MQCMRGYAWQWVAPSATFFCVLLVNDLHFVWNLKVSAKYPTFWAFLATSTAVWHCSSHLELRSSLLGSSEEPFALLIKRESYSQHLHFTSHSWNMGTMSAVAAAAILQPWGNKHKDEYIKKSRAESPRERGLWWHCQAAAWSLDTA